MTRGVNTGGRPGNGATEQHAGSPAGGSGEGPSTRERAPSSAGRTAWIVAAAEKIRALPGVLGATLHGRDGPAPGLAPRTTEEVAAASLVPASQRLIEALRMGRAALAFGRGADRLLVAIHAGEYWLTVHLSDDSQADAIKAQIRALLAPPR